MSSTEAQDRLSALIAEAQSLSTYPNISWGDYCWEINGLGLQRAHDKRERRLYFTRREDVNVTLGLVKAQGKANKRIYVSFKDPFADFAKVIVRMRASQRGVGYSFQKAMVMALRWLYESMLRTSGPDPISLTRQHFQDAVTDAAKYHGHQSAFAIGQLLEEISNFVDEHQLGLKRINFKNPIEHPTPGDGRDEESQEKGMKKMPSQAALDALATASNEPLDEDEQIILRALDLLVVGGFRIGEMLTIPVNCWVEEEVIENGREKFDPMTGEPLKKYGIRYWPEKGGELGVKHLTSITVPLAKRAVEDLTRLCSDARNAAAALEGTPDRVPLPGGLDLNATLTRHQLQKALGFNSWGGLRCFIDELGIQPAEKKAGIGRGLPRNCYRVGDVEKALMKRRPELITVKLKNGSKQTLSESLCVMFLNQFHKARATLRFLPELISTRQIDIALGGVSNSESIFTRRGLKNPDGSRMSINTHAFRHWLNTLADNGGLSGLLLALWMGRKDINQNVWYKHGTVAQRVEWAREAMKNGDLSGDIVDIYNSINDPVKKEDFLKTFVSVAHFTPYGVCLHDFALEPCEYHLNCLSGCGEYIRTKGDEEERKNIRQLRVFTQRELDMAQKALEAGEYGASNWVEHNARIVKACIAAEAVDADQSVATGQPVHVFPGGETMGKPLENTF